MNEQGVLARALAGVRPVDRASLRGWVKAGLGVDVPDRATCAGHGSPMDYLEHSFFERGDVVVWASRGGGKTFYGAVASLLDMVFKPGIAICVLGGSFDQSARMHAYLRMLLDRPGWRGLVDGRITQRGVRLTNGSQLTLLAQAETSVRGQRVQKLRCDEVELFDRDVWHAAQYVTRSKVCGGQLVPGTIECFSTMHRPYGLMAELVGEGGANSKFENRNSKGEARPLEDLGSGLGGTLSRKRHVIKWCAMDVIARCEEERECETCSLWEYCGGRAKEARGFVAVEDVLAQQRRSSRVGFESEMLCRRPSRRDAVFPAFDPAVHVQAVEHDAKLKWVGGMDFGIRSPLVMLWAQLKEVEPRRNPADGAAAGLGGVQVQVMDEYVATDRTVEAHIREIERRGPHPNPLPRGEGVWPRCEWIGVDPAGCARNEQTGHSNVAVLRAAGWRVRHRRVDLATGLELLRSKIEPAAGGEVGLMVHPRCERLIESLAGYHFDEERPESVTPVKDGFDHAVDALRYMMVNLEGVGRVEVKSY